MALLRPEDLGGLPAAGAHFSMQLKRISSKLDTRGYIATGEVELTVALHYCVQRITEPVG